MKRTMRVALVAGTIAAALTVSGAGGAQSSGEVLEGKAAFTDWHADRPGLRRHIRPADLPAANLAGSSSNGVRIAHRAAAEKPVVPPGFEVTLSAEGLDQPRLIRAAPN